ncbi:MAG TPA: isochorismatase family protein [Bacteriovoracaceae bacterium]|nr:isochorismatase family protein [Bacteriovoracaceae bacterium]
MKTKRLKFPLTSEQLELLIAFEQNGNLSKLAEHMGKDQSVISRQLQKLGEDCPVISKVNGKWAMTPLWIKINELTSRVVAEYEKNLVGEVNSFFNWESSALVIVNAQKALLNSMVQRSNLDAEKNIQALLSCWRKKNGKILHIQHISRNPNSDFFVESPLAQFMVEISPMEDESVIQKMHASSFSDTQLESFLKGQSISSIVLAGFTANDCIEAIARDSFEKGFNTYVVGDATAMFDFVAHDKKLYKAEKIHELVLANIGLRYGQVEDTKFFSEM